MMNKNTVNLNKLVTARLGELGCAELPAAVRAKLETEVANRWHDTAKRLVTKTITAKHLAHTFAANIGNNCGKAINQPPGMPPKPPEPPGVSGDEIP